MPYALIDLFAGPGGLNEGFSSVLDDRGHPVFKTVVSIECERWAHQTLELRALFRHLRGSDKLDDYYDYLRGKLTREQLFNRAGDLGKAAKVEALSATLGESEEANSTIERQIEDSIKSSGCTESVIIGGPPCQAYSLAGRSRRAREDIEEFERDHKHFLYREYLRIVGKVRPIAFVMENVPGLLSAKHTGRLMFERICGDLENSGYDLHTLNPFESTKSEVDPRRFIVRAEDFGVPQARARIFIIGLRRGSGLIAQKLNFNANQRVTVGDAISDLPRLRSKLSKEPDSAEQWVEALTHLRKLKFLGIGDELRAELYKELDALAAVTPPPIGQKLMAVTGKSPAALRDWYRRDAPEFLTNHNSRGHMRRDLFRYFFWATFGQIHGRSPTMKDGPTFLLPNHSNVHNVPEEIPFADRFRVQISEKPSTTIVSHISKDGHYYIHPDPSQCRSLSVREAARLQTFPDCYHFEGAVTDQYRQVGNAVPPYLAFQIGQTIQAALSGIRLEVAPQEQLPLRIS